MRLNPSEGVISNQKNYQTDNSHEETVEVESVYTGGSEDMEQSPSDHDADNSQQYVKQNALPSPVYKLAAYEPRHQTEYYPRQK